MRRFFSPLTTAILLILFVCPANCSAIELPKPTGYVEDHSNVINASDEHSLNGILQELDHSSRAAVIPQLQHPSDLGIPGNQIAHAPSGH